MLQTDLATIERIWADDYTFTAPNGVVVSKSQYMAMLKSGAVKYESLSLESVTTRVYSDAATVVGVVAVKGKVVDHITNGRDRFLSVYLRRDGRWQEVATLATRIPGSTVQ